MPIELVVAENEAGTRLDRFLTTKLDLQAEDGASLTRSQLKRAIDDGGATVDGKRARPGQKLKSGQLVSFVKPEPPPLSVQPEAIPLDIAFEDEHLIVVSKPAGMVVHPAAGNWTGTLVAALLAHCELDSGEKMRPGIVHRIDKDTTGLLVVAKDVTTHEGLARQFHDHTIDREYLALVRRVPKVRDTIRTRYGRHPRNRLKFSSRFNGPKEAITHYELVESFANAAALITCRLETGRTHQVRVHLAEAGHPLLGDKLYGGTTGGDHRLEAPLACIDRQALHAARLGFTHPITGARVDLRRDAPEDFQTALKELRCID